MYPIQDKMKTQPDKGSMSFLSTSYWKTYSPVTLKGSQLPQCASFCHTSEPLLSLLTAWKRSHVLPFSSSLSSSQHLFTYQMPNPPLKLMQVVITSLMNGLMNKDLLRAHYRPEHLWLLWPQCNTLQISFLLLGFLLFFPDKPTFNLRLKLS